MNLASSLFILKIGQKWFDTRTGWLSAGIFLFISVNSNTQGLISNCEPLVVLFLLAAVFLLSRQAYFWAGLCAALCLMMKQQALFFIDFFCRLFHR
ncbi:MAG: hypothetical protein HC817_01770 [Saprospiraceae bacterium]|nr:hypothetical protein [Saprospiraceae bacterium]